MFVLYASTGICCFVCNNMHEDNTYMYACNLNESLRVAGDVTTTV